MCLVRKERSDYITPSLKSPKRAIKIPQLTKNILTSQVTIQLLKGMSTNLVGRLNSVVIS